MLKSDLPMLVSERVIEKPPIAIIVKHSPKISLYLSFALSVHKMSFCRHALTCRKPLRDLTKVKKGGIC